MDGNMGAAFAEFIGLRVDQIQEPDKMPWWNEFVAFRAGWGAANRAAEEYQRWLDQIPSKCLRTEWLHQQWS